MTRYVSFITQSKKDYRFNNKLEMKDISEITFSPSYR